MIRTLIVIGMVALCTVPTKEVNAQGKATVAKEVAKRMLSKFGGETAGESVESLAGKIDNLVVRHGDQAASAVETVGPRAFKLIAEAGENGTDAAKLMAKHGDDAIWVVTKPNRMAIFIKFGDDAGEAMIKHKEIAEGLISKFGVDAATALSKLTPQNARRIAMMNGEGVFNHLSRSDELLATIAKYGDPAADFIWRNKGALMVTAGLGAFLADPEPFINGTSKLADSVVDNTAGRLADGVASATNWTFIFSLGLSVVGVLAFFRMRKRRTSAE